MRREIALGSLLALLAVAVPAGAQTVSDQDLQKYTQVMRRIKQEYPTLNRSPHGVPMDVRRAQLADVLKGTGWTNQDFLRLHDRVMSDPALHYRLGKQLAEADSPGGTATSGAAAASSPAAATDGAASSGAQPGTSPK
jgi:hypothetical protein